MIMNGIFMFCRDFTPVPATDYFGKARFIGVNETDRLYLYETDAPGEEHSTAPYLLFLHGGGYSGLTWAPLIQQLSPMFTAQFGAVDIRGHGRSTCENEADLSTENVTECDKQFRLLEIILSVGENNGMYLTLQGFVSAGTKVRPWIKTIDFNWTLHGWCICYTFIN